jgi:DNA-binding MarR family transcriptional regulator
MYPLDMKTPCYCAAARVIARKTTSIYDDALAPAGVNLAQYSLLRKIEWGVSPSLTELARLAELDRSTIGRNVRVLERMELASLSAAEDQREAVVRLTPKGAETLRLARPLWDGAQDRVETTLGERAKDLIELARAL